MNFEQIAVEYNNATALLNRNQAKKAIPIYKKCLKNWEFKEAFVNIGNCYRLEDAPHALRIDMYNKALSDRVPSIEKDAAPVIGHALNNLGLAYYAIGDDVRALDCYEKAIALNPKFWEAVWNKSTCLLRQACSGRSELFASGWECYDARFLKTPPVKLKNNRDNLFYWEPAKGGGPAIVVLAEQGIGDNIMFGRYLSSLRGLFERVYIQCDLDTEVLFPDYICVRDAIDCPETDIVAYPMCSLAKCFNNGIPTPGDYLRGRFSARTFDSSRFNVGIVWDGSPTHANNRHRSVNIGRFSRLASIANLYSLSPGFKSTKYVRGLDIKTWKDTAECINGLDLVISVDTSVVHMCGALGREAWVLQPTEETDFRWGNGVSRSPWYPSIEIFNNPGSWEPVFDMVEKRLRERVNG